MNQKESAAVPDVKEEEWEKQIATWRGNARDSTYQIHCGSRTIAKVLGVDNTYALLTEHKASIQRALEKTKAFKDFVHRRLDTAGVPKEFPDGEHTKEGCRIGDRLDWVLEKRDTPSDNVKAQEQITFPVDATDCAPYWLCYAMAESQYIQNRDCERYEDSDCAQTADCITEWCTVCAAKAWLKSQNASSVLDGRKSANAAWADGREFVWGFRYWDKDGSGKVHISAGHRTQEVAEEIVATLTAKGWECSGLKGGFQDAELLSEADGQPESATGASLEKAIEQTEAWLGYDETWEVDLDGLDRIDQCLATLRKVKQLAVLSPLPDKGEQKENP